MVSPITSSRRTPLPGSNVGVSAAVYKSLPTSKALNTSFRSSRFFRAHPFRPSVRARATHQEAIVQAIPPLNQSNLCIRGVRRPPLQPHGEIRLSARMPAGVLSEGGFSSNKGAAPPCQLHLRLGHRHPRNHPRKYCNNRPRLGRLLLPPPVRRILQGRNQYCPPPIQAQGSPIIHWVEDLQLLNGAQRHSCTGRIFSLLFTTQKN